MSAAVRVIEKGVGAEPVAVIPDDLPEVVDASRKGAGGGVGIVESGVSAAAEEEPMMPLASVYLPTIWPAALMPFAGQPRDNRFSNPALDAHSGCQGGRQCVKFVGADGAWLESARSRQTEEGTL